MQCVVKAHQRESRPQLQTTAALQDSHVARHQETWRGSHGKHGCFQAPQHTWSCQWPQALHPGCVAADSPDLYTALGLYVRQNYPALPQCSSTAHQHSRTGPEMTCLTSTTASHMLKHNSLNVTVSKFILTLHWPVTLTSTIHHFAITVISVAQHAWWKQHRNRLRLRKKYHNIIWHETPLKWHYSIYDMTYRAITTLEGVKFSTEITNHKY